ncbi:carbohydrate kinase family protein [Microbacterium sp. B19]|uniref:carbohydrate kinase family protein n=1 Tax=Microbacterium sp. B19 TaxID=96765 RepID=UPI00034D7DF8|nr:carbohydrate kinase family protein [Microbacterium sp. B19]
MSGLTRIVGGFTVDAVALADGSYDVDRPGGNGFWAAMGAALAGGAVAVHGVVGADFPLAALDRLSECGVGVDGIHRRSDIPNLRVSFSYAPDESRAHPADPAAIVHVPLADRARFLDTTDRADLLHATLPAGTDLAGASADAWYLGLLPASRLRETVDAVRGHGWTLLDCPDRRELAQSGNGALRDVLPGVDVFLPSTSDAAMFLPDVAEHDLPALFHAWGADAVVLKCGSRGAVLSQSGRRWGVPVFRDPDACDPTGAGDVFGGACAAVMADTGDLFSAVVAGAVAASFATAARSPLDLARVAREDYDLRRDVIAAGVEDV